MTAAISLNSVHLSYGSRKVLDDFSLELEQGSFTALLGPNGAGKSTIFNLLAGLLLPDQGEVRIMGHSTNGDIRAALGQVAMVFQHAALDGELSIYQNMRYFCGLHAVKNPQPKIEKWLGEFDLLDRIHEPVHLLNGGHKRRLEIARALVTSPSVLLLDEPTTGLDPASKEIIVAHAHRLAENGVCVLWITHLLDELRELDHVIILDQGKIADQGRLGDLGGAGRVVERYAQPGRLGL